MSIGFMFSCGKTDIDLRPFKEKGYTVTCNSSMILNGDTLFMVEVSRLETMEFYCYTSIRGNPTIVNNVLHIPEQTQAFFISSNHPTNDICVYLNLNNIVINNISIKDDNDLDEYTAPDEECFVLDLMLEKIENCSPFTQKWIDFYNKYSPVSKQIMRDSREMTENSMRSLIILEEMSKALKNV